MTNEEAATLLEQWSYKGLSDGFNEAATMGADALRSHDTGAEAMREAAAKKAEEWVCIPEIARAIRALPLPAPEVPEDGIERDWFDSSDAVTGAGDK